MEVSPAITQSTLDDPATTRPYPAGGQRRPEPGVEVLPGYRLVSKVGEGGYGQVWAAEAPGGGRVALKFVSANAKLVEPELRALSALRDVRHPHLLELYFHTLLPEWLVICTPLCEGSLHHRLDSHTGTPGLPVADLCRYMSQAASAVDHLNTPAPESGRPAGMQHRDIKPHNLLLFGGVVKVADFGLAKVLENTVGSHSGALTPGYAAPEMFEGVTTASSDQYSLAVTYVELRTGRLPFRGGPAEVMYGHLHADPDLGELPAAERAVVARALSKVPTDRWASCTEFATRLRGAACVPPRPGGRFRPWLAAVLARTDYEPPRVRANRRKGRWAVLFGLGLLGLAGAVGVTPVSAEFAEGYTLKVIGIALFGGLGAALFVAGAFNALTGSDCMGGK